MSNKKKKRQNDDREKERETREVGLMVLIGRKQKCHREPFMIYIYISLSIYIYNLRCLTMSDYRWYQDVFLSCVMVKFDN
jgi:hypothetical protein